MAHQQKLEQILDMLINEEKDAATELLHSVIVEKARTMYEDLVEEDFGGDEKEDFADEIEADKDEIESDEIFDDEGEEGEDEEDEESDESADEEEVEDRLEDVEAQIADLTARFEQIVDGDEGVEDFGDEEVVGDEAFGDVEADFEEGMYEEVIEELDEATKLQDEVKGNPLDSEGKLTGTGNKSKTGATGKESPFTRQPKKGPSHGGEPHKTGLGGDESSKKVGEGEDNTPTSNINVDKDKKQSAKYTNNPADDKGAVSPLGSKGSPKGA